MEEPRQIQQRKGNPQDLPFLWNLHVSAMKAYVEQTWGWDEVFQKAHFKKTVIPERLWILESGGEPIGALETEFREDHLFLGRISLIPSHQGLGIGSRIIRQLQQDAFSRNLPIHLQVLRENPAHRLYERLGFLTGTTTETHHLMVCPVPSSDSLRA